MSVVLPAPFGAPPGPNGLARRARRDRRVAKHRACRSASPARQRAGQSRSRILASRDNITLCSNPRSLKSGTSPSVTIARAPVPARHRPRDLRAAAWSASWGSRAAARPRCCGSSWGLTCPAAAPRAVARGGHRQARPRRALTACGARRACCSSSARCSPTCRSTTKRRIFRCVSTPELSR